MDIQWILLGLVKIIVINIALSGHNAVVIALASRNLPPEQQKKAILLGSFGALALRIVLIFAAVWLLHIPYVQIGGGLLLMYIAVKLLKDDGQEEKLNSSKHLGEAIKTIIIAHIVMSLDNVLAVADAASGNFLLIGLGLGISIPVIVWGSKMLMRLMHRFPIIVLCGAGLLGYTAGEMIVSDKMIGHVLETVFPALHYVLPVAFMLLVIIVGNMLKKQKKPIVRLTIYRKLLLSFIALLSLLAVNSAVSLKNIGSIEGKTASLSQGDLPRVILLGTLSQNIMTIDDLLLRIVLEPDESKIKLLLERFETKLEETKKGINRYAEMVSGEEDNLTYLLVVATWNDYYSRLPVIIEVSKSSDVTNKEALIRPTDPILGRVQQYLNQLTDMNRQTANRSAEEASSSYRDVR